MQTLSGTKIYACASCAQHIASSANKLDEDIGFGPNTGFMFSEVINIEKTVTQDHVASFEWAISCSHCSSELGVMKKDGRVMIMKNRLQKVGDWFDSCGENVVVEEMPLGLGESRVTRKVGGRNVNEPAYIELYTYEYGNPNIQRCVYRDAASARQVLALPHMSSCNGINNCPYCRAEEPESVETDIDF